jgi:hypothetical protein
MSWQVSGATDLPFGDRERDWDEASARDRIFRWAGWEDHPQPEKAQKAFFACDDDKPTNLTAYKLPFADVVGGELQAMPRGLFAVAQLLQGARDGIDLPEDVLRDIRRRVTTYYRKMGEAPPWEEPGGETEKGMPGKLTARKRETRVKAAHKAARTRQARGTQRTGSRKKSPEARKKRARAARTAAQTRRTHATR